MRASSPARGRLRWGTIIMCRNYLKSPNCRNSILLPTLTLPELGRGHAKLLPRLGEDWDGERLIMCKNFSFSKFFNNITYFNLPDSQYYLYSILSVFSRLNQKLQFPHHNKIYPYSHVAAILAHKVLFQMCGLCHRTL